MNDNQRPHFWIPDQEVERVPKKPRGRDKTRDIVHSEHGAKLSQGLQTVKQTLETTQNDDSLRDVDLYVFKVELPEKEKVQNRSNLFSKNGMTVNAVKDERRAIVSTTKQKFQMLKNRVDAYTQNGTNKTHFDYVESIAPYVGVEKESDELRKKIYHTSPPEKIDIQLMFIPNLQTQEYELIIKRMKEKIKATDGVIQQDIYYLSDNTPVMRVIIPSAALNRYENDSAVYRIEETRFFNAVVDDQNKIELNSQVDVASLPIVAVLDSGVKFNKQYDQLIVEHWKAPDSSGGNCEHGTRVASKVAFAHLGKQLTTSQILTPRTRIIDCNILDGNVPENIMIQRIQAAVDKYADVTKIFNLSANSSSPIDGNEMSILGFELDVLQLKRGVQFVVSAGNHYLWRTNTSLDKILDDDDSKIAAPADSMLSIVVGALVGEDHQGSISGKDTVAPYSRCGPGFTGSLRPDVCAYSGTIVVDENGAHVPCDPYALVMTPDGTITPDVGTSFAAPIVAGDLAEIQTIVPDSNILLAKTLLYQYAQPPIQVAKPQDDDLNFIHRLYGRGISSVASSKFSSPSRVTFVRTGTLNRLTKERVKIYMPKILASKYGKNTARVTVTCISQPPVDRTKGSEYLGAYVGASLKKIGKHGKLTPVEQPHKEGRRKWDVCNQFSKVFSKFNAGDWQVWLELFSRWDDKVADIPYALVITIEDLSGELDIYNEIQEQNRFQEIDTFRLKIDS